MTSKRNPRRVTRGGQTNNRKKAVAATRAALRAASTQSLEGRLDLLASAHGTAARGYGFEQLLFELLVENGFRVHRNAGMARPRQSDLVAQDAHQQFLIEAKARGKSIDCSDIDAMFARLARTPPDVVGVFFSLSDYTQPA